MMVKALACPSALFCFPARHTPAIGGQRSSLSQLGFRVGGNINSNKSKLAASFRSRCLIHGLGGAGFWDWDGHVPDGENNNSYPNNQFNFTKGNSAKGGSVLLSLVQEIEPLDVSLIQKDVSADTVDAMKRTVTGILGVLPSDQFHVLIEAFWEPLSKLLVSSMMTGYTLRNAEYRLCLQKSFEMSEDSSLAQKEEETDSEEALLDGNNKILDSIEESLKISETEASPEESATLQEFDIPKGLGELSPEAQNYIRCLQSQLSQVTNELQESQLKSAALQMQNLVGEEKNDLLDFLRSLEPEKVVVYLWNKGYNALFRAYGQIDYYKDTFPPTPVSTSVRYCQA